jgi:hypothetical protein
MIDRTPVADLGLIRHADAIPHIGDPWPYWGWPHENPWAWGQCVTVKIWVRHVFARGKLQQVVDWERYSYVVLPVPPSAWDGAPTLLSGPWGGTNPGDED